MVLGAGFVLLFLVVLTLPWWLAPALGWFVPDEVLKIEGSADGTGPGSVEWGRVTFSQPSLRVVADGVSFHAPLRWVNLLIGRESGSPLFRAERVEVTIDGGPVEEDQADESRAGLDGVNALMADLDRYLELARRWTPWLEIGSVQVHHPSAKVQVRSLLWKDGALSLEADVGVQEREAEHLEWRLVSSPGGLNMRIGLPVREIAFNLEWRNRNDGGRLTWKLSHRQSGLEGSAVWKDGWLPDQAEWRTDDWKVAYGDIGLASDGMEADEDALVLDWSGHWKDGAHRQELRLLAGDGSSSDALRSGTLPLLIARAELEGDADRISLSDFQVEGDGLLARVRDPLTYDWEMKLLSGSVGAALDFDLSRLGVEGLTGTLIGGINTEGLSLDAETHPVVSLELNGESLRFREYPQLDLGLKASWSGDSILLDTFQVTAGHGSVARMKGSWNYGTGDLGVCDVYLDLKREDVDAFVPDKVRWTRLEGGIQADGPVKEIRYAGELSADGIQYPGGLDAVGMMAEFGGNLRELYTASLVLIHPGGALIGLEGALNWEEKTDLMVRGIEWHASDGRVLRLSEPFGVDFGSDGQVSVGHIKLRETVEGGARVEAQWASGDMSSGALEVEKWSPLLWVNPWVSVPLDALEIDRMDAEVSLAGGDLSFAWNGAIQAGFRGADYRMGGGLKLGEDGIRAESVEVSGPEEMRILLNGGIPYRLNMGEGRRLSRIDHGMFDLTVSWDDAGGWLRNQVENLPVPVESLALRLEIDGPSDDPGVALEGNMRTRSSANGEINIPALDWTLSAEWDASGVRVPLRIDSEIGSFEVEGVVDPGVALVDVLDGKLDGVDPMQMPFEFEVPPSSLSPLAMLASEMMRPEGTIEARVKGTVRDGVEGFVRMDGAHTRAIFPFGAIRDMKSEWHLSGKKITLREFSGFLGREPVRISGDLDASDWENPTGGLTVKGEGISLVRQGGLLLRADLDLKLGRSKALDPWVVKGQVRLRDGLLLMDSSALLAAPGGATRSATSRPPYFSVSASPWNQFRLNIDVVGDRFMRLRTPALIGSLSIDMKMKGTMENPFLSGRAFFDEGRVLFPFAAFDIESGGVELRSDQPYDPVVDLKGNSRRLGYDLSMDVSGYAADPVVRFTSNPPLSSEEILLMVLSGDNPRGGMRSSSASRAGRLGQYLAQGLFASPDGSEHSLISRFEMQSGAKLSKQGKETLEMEFRLNDRFQILGEYDEYDFWNTGIRFRVLSHGRFQKPSEEGEEE